MTLIDICTRVLSPKQLEDRVARKERSGLREAMVHDLQNPRNPLRSLRATVNNRFNLMPLIVYVSQLKEFIQHQPASIIIEIQ